MSTIMRQNFDALLNRALMNNSFDYDSLDATLDKNYNNAFSTLLHRHGENVGCPMLQFFSSDKSHYRETYVNSDESVAYTEASPDMYEKYTISDDGTYKLEGMVSAIDVDISGLTKSYKLWQWNNKQPGNLYVDSRRKASVRIPKNLFTTNTETYRNSCYYDQWIEYKDLMNRTDIFYKIPIIIIDDKVVYRCQIKFIADGFIVRLPYDKGFVYDLTYHDREHDRYFDRPKFIEHEIKVLIINNYFNMTLTSLPQLLNRQGNKLTIPLNDRGRLSLLQAAQTSTSTEFNTIYKITGQLFRDEANAKKYLLEVIEECKNRMENLTGDADKAYELGTVEYAYRNDLSMYQDLLSRLSIAYTRYTNLLHKPEIYQEEFGIFFMSLSYATDTSNLIPGVLKDGNIQFILPETTVNDISKIGSRQAIRVNIFFLKDLKRHKFGDGYIIPTTYGNGTEAPLLLIEESPLTLKKLPVPIGNFIIYNSKGSDFYRMVNPYHTLKLHYPNMYEFIDRAMVGGTDTYQVFYYYKEIDNYRYRPLYQFFFDFMYLYLKAEGDTPQDVLNGVYFALKDYDTFRDYLSKRLINITENGYDSFKDWFDHCFNYEFYEYKYGPDDFDAYVKNNCVGIDGGVLTGKIISPFEYKDALLRDWIDRDPYVLRDYVLHQHKLGDTFHVYTNSIEPPLTDRLRVSTEPETGTDSEFYTEFSEDRYVFTFLNEFRDPSRELDVCLYVDGILCDNLYHFRSGSVEYVYVPVSMFRDPDDPVGSYVYVDVFPRYSKVETFNFATMNSEKSFSLPLIDTTSAKYVNVVVDKNGDVVGMYEDAQIQIAVSKAGAMDVVNLLAGIQSGVYSTDVLSDSVPLTTLTHDTYYVDNSTGLVYRFYGTDGSTAITEQMDSRSGKIFPTIQDLQFIEVMKTQEQIDSSADPLLSIGDWINYSWNFFKVIGEFVFYRPVAYTYTKTITQDGVEYPVRYPRLLRFRVKPNYSDVIGRDIEMRINKLPNGEAIKLKTSKPLSYDEALLGDEEIRLRFDPAHSKFTFNKDYIKLYHNGRLICDYQYTLHRRHAYPWINLLYPTEDKHTYAENDIVYVNVAPYIYRQVYYAETIPETCLIDLTGIVNKPFDIRYFDVYLNGRRLGTQNVINISPTLIALINIKSLHNLIIYERERDYEFYGEDYADRSDDKYRDLSILLKEDFMESFGGPRKLIVHVINRRKDKECIVEPNTNDETPLDYSDLISNLDLDEFYYDELIPKTSANPDQWQYNTEHLKEDFPSIYTTFRVDDKTLMLNPDVALCNGVVRTPLDMDGDIDTPKRPLKTYVVGHPEGIKDGEVHELLSNIGGETE